VLAEEGQLHARFERREVRGGSAAWLFRRQRDGEEGTGGLALQDRASLSWLPACDNDAAIGPTYLAPARCVQEAAHRRTL
jgi:hypothetical protein